MSEQEAKQGNPTEWQYVLILIMYTTEFSPELITKYFHIHFQDLS